MPTLPPLWKGNYKINTDERGFNFSVHCVATLDSDARIKFNDLGARMKLLLPKSAEVFYASFTKWDSKRDGRFLADCVGPGSFVEDDGPPELSDYDFARTCINIRMENDNGGIATLKWAAVPDSIVYGGRVTDTIAPVIGVPAGAVPDPGAGADWFNEFTNFMAAIVKNFTHIESGGLPGADYVPRAYINAYAARVSQKKGGRVFI